jgi:hypothetical protein
MINNLFKVNKDKSILIPIPNQKEKLSIGLIDFVQQKGLKIIYIKINNRDSFKQLTDNIIKHYVNKEMVYHLKLYSFEDEDLIYFDISS